MCRNISRVFSLLLSLALVLSASARSIRVACIGNSVTAGYLLDNKSAESYPAVLQRLLGEQYEVGNFGYSGATLLSDGHKPYIQTKEFQQALAWNADVFIIHLGLNDVNPQLWKSRSAQFVVDYNILIDSLTHKNPDKRVLLAQMSPILSTYPSFTDGMRDVYNQIQAAIQQVAESRRLELINLSTPLYNYPHLLPDAVHPNKEGADRIAKYVYGCLTGDWGGLSMSPYYASGMVLQRGRLIRLVGRANTGTRVSIYVNKSKMYYAVANTEGKWSALIDSLSTSSSHSITIRAGKQSLQYDDVLAGDVWLTSGEGNMYAPLSSIDNLNLRGIADDSRLRYFSMKPIAEPSKGAWSYALLNQVNNLEYYQSKGWSHTGDLTSMQRWSAVAYHFARKLRDSLPDVPIAIIANPLVGVPLESWVSQSSLERRYPDMLNDWLNKNYAMSWVRETARDNIVLHPKEQRHPYEPAYMYAQAIEPLKGVGLKGIIWYHGDSNIDNPNLYKKLFPLMVQDWRNLFGPKIPVYTVQLSGGETRPSWSPFRFLQVDLSSKSIGGKSDQEYVYIVPSYDVSAPLDMNTNSKIIIGERLAKQALTYTYGMERAYEQTIMGDIMLVKEGRRYYLCSDTGYIKQFAKSKRIKGFEFAYSDQIFFPVELEQDKGGRLYLRKDIGEGLLYYRYAYQPYTDANLLNSLGIPVLPSLGKVAYYSLDY